VQHEFVDARIAAHSNPLAHMRFIADYSCDDLCYMAIGYVTRIFEVLQEQRKQRNGLYFAGEYVAGAHTAAACASGRDVAKLIAKHWA